MTFGEIARRLEEKGKLKVYDFALPQPWFNDVLDKVGVNPAGHIVWCYDKRRICGEPFSITLLGHQILKIYEVSQ